jgi:hypothetical protein
MTGISTLLSADPEIRTNRKILGVWTFVPSNSEAELQNADAGSDAPPPSLRERRRAEDAQSPAQPLADDEERHRQPEGLKEGEQPIRLSPRQQQNASHD